MQEKATWAPNYSFCSYQDRCLHRTLFAVARRGANLTTQQFLIRKLEKRSRRIPPEPPSPRALSRRYATIMAVKRDGAGEYMSGSTVSMWVPVTMRVWSRRAPRVPAASSRVTGGRHPRVSTGSQLAEAPSINTCTELGSMSNASNSNCLWSDCYLHRCVGICLARLYLHITRWLGDLGMELYIFKPLLLDTFTA